ncbi:MAG: type II restriction endonuclease [Planctomycetaceae bacterium]|nr:type II restriction endonuclease [Planctomycetaceae bacterium]
MAKEIVLSIKSPTNLVTPHEATRAGFMAMALEKNFLASPFVEQAKTLKILASQAKTPNDLLSIVEIREGLLTASGLSDKALNHLSDTDKTNTIKNLIERFLEPVGVAFVDELVYRFLMVKGDTLGGKARNLAGSLGVQKFFRAMISSFSLAGIEYQWLDSELQQWKSATNEAGFEKRVKAFYWNDRLFYLNLNVPLVGKNVDMILLNGKQNEPIRGKNSLLLQPDKYIALGELKAGIDPAGADEHWKTAATALKRIRESFEREGLNPLTFFIGAVIEKAMAKEIFEQLQNKTLSHAANLTNEEQLTMICQWIIKL